jgi:hypothetical protein
MKIMARHSSATPREETSTTPQGTLTPREKASTLQQETSRPHQEASTLRKRKINSAGRRIQRPQLNS